VRVGQDLHDGLGQELTSLVCLIESLGRKLEGRYGTEDDYLPKIQELVKKVVIQIRGLSRSLRPVTIERSGLSAALLELTTTVRHVSGITCEFNSEELVRVTADTATHVYRIVQEALNNAVRHAKARNIKVMLKNTNGGIALTVRDDGIGIPNEGERMVGLGLKTMSYRARIIGADLRIGREPEGGTTVECMIAVGGNHAPVRRLGTWRSSARHGETSAVNTGQVAKA
jgi:signal transduction histidine kinase